MKPILLFDSDNPHIVWDTAHMGVYKNNELIIGSDRNDFRDHLMEHDGVKFVTQIVKAVLVRLKLMDSPMAPQLIDDIQGHPIVVTIGIPVPDNQSFALDLHGPLIHLTL